MAAPAILLGGEAAAPSSAARGQGANGGGGVGARCKYHAQQHSPSGGAVPAVSSSARSDGSPCDSFPVGPRGWWRGRRWPRSRIRQAATQRRRRRRRGGRERLVAGAGALESNPRVAPVALCWGSSGAEQRDVAGSRAPASSWAAFVGGGAAGACSRGGGGRRGVSDVVGGRLEVCGC